MQKKADRLSCTDLALWATAPTSIAYHCKNRRGLPICSSPPWLPATQNCPLCVPAIVLTGPSAEITYITGRKLSTAGPEDHQCPHKVSYRSSQPGKRGKRWNSPSWCQHTTVSAHTLLWKSSQSCWAASSGTPQKVAWISTLQSIHAAHAAHTDTHSQIYQQVLLCMS